MDYYFQSTDYNTLAGMLTTMQGGFFGLKYTNVLGPKQGRAEVAEYTTEEGVIVAAQPAVGDPATYYISIRTEDEITPPEGVSVAEASVVQELLGVWA